MSKPQSTTRETKAAELIQSGAVQLFIGEARAEVRGSRGVSYIVTREGCSCPDRQYRGAGCCHELAVKQLCDEFRACRAAAERGERIRPSRHLLQALHRV